MHAPPLGAVSLFRQFSDTWKGFYNPEPANYKLEKIDYFNHNRCICMNEFLIVATTVKSGSTKQSKVMD